MYLAAVFLPLIGSILAGLVILYGTVTHSERKKQLDRTAQIVTVGAMLLSAIAATVAFMDVVVYGNSVVIKVSPWVQSGSLNFSWELRGDTLSLIMLLMVTWVSSMIHIYSIGYMSHDSSIPRFMCYLSLFTFFMLMLATSNNLVQLFFGWEGVGLMSYLLIGFWYERSAACSAAIKAFLVNRVGDFGFALGIFATFLLFDSISFDTIFGLAKSKSDAVITIFGGEFHALTAICLLLFMGKGLFRRM